MCPLPNFFGSTADRYYFFFYVLPIIYIILYAVYKYYYAIDIARGHPSMLDERVIGDVEVAEGSGKTC